MSTPDRRPDGIPDALRQALLGGAADRLTGVLRVAGRPGGTVHFADGTVIAAETPGAPGLEVLLFRAGRVDESSWDAAFAAAASTGREMSNELIGRELAGAGELEALSRLAIADAIFAMAYGTVDASKRSVPVPTPMITLRPGEEAGRLLAETARRIRSLEAFPGPAARVVTAPGALTRGAALGGGRDELAALADGRRTPRDLAFALGQGVYATMLELGRLQADGLVMMIAPGPVAPMATPAASRPPATADRAGTAESPPLPRRGRDQSATAKTGGRELPAAFRMLRLRYGEGTAPGQAR